MVCLKCGAKEDAEAITISEKKIETKRPVDVTEDLETLPITEAECPKCKNKEAYWWLRQTRGGDEPETRFFKCTKCKHTWRERS